MESKDLYRHLLGLTEPWTVERVELDTVKMHVEVHAGHAPKTRFACPQCGVEPGGTCMSMNCPYSVKITC